MVYCGKPSEACQDCRDRKIKCDLTKPSCLQCTKIGRQCPGYRNLQDLMFRDESKSVIRKAKVREARKRERRNQELSSSIRKSKPTPPESPDQWGQEFEDISALIPASDWSSPDVDRIESLMDLQDLIPKSLIAPLEDVATTFFFSHYIMIGHMAFLPSLFAKESHSEALQTVIISIGLAGLANASNEPAIMKKSRNMYGLALTMTNNALSNPEVAADDMTLMLVMLLSIYDVVTLSSFRSLPSLTTHIQGAATLLQLRGQKQFQTLLGLQLFLHVRAQIILTCVINEIEVPSLPLLPITTSTPQVVDYISAEEQNPIDSLQRFKLENHHLRGLEDGAIGLGQIAIRFASLRASVREGKLSHPSDIVSAGFQIDRELARWQEQLPSSWNYETIFTSPGSGFDEFPGDTYCVYPSLMLAYIWNNYRCIRILVIECILTHAARLTKSQYELLSDASINDLYFNLADLASGILASIPFQLSQEFSSSPDNDAYSSVPPGCYLMMWPLFVAGAVDVASSAQREWATEKLDWIARGLGVQQGSALAQALRERHFS